MSKKSWESNGQWFSDQLEALISAFIDSESSLRIMVRSQLNVHFETIKQGDNFKEHVASLIEWAEAQGKIKQLVIGAASERSNNPRIRQFIETYFTYLVESNIDPLYDFATTRLINILERTNDFNDIWMIGKTILPNQVEVHCSQKVRCFASPDCSNWFKCFILLKLLLEDYPGSSERPSIFTFVQNLLQKSALSGEIKQELRDWFQEVDPNFTPQSILQPTNEFDRSTGGELKAHLMITVNSERSKFRVNASLLCIPPTGDSKRIQLILNPNSTVRGELCTKSQIPKKLAEFIDICVSHLDNADQNNLLGCTSYTLIVELFLPSVMLCEPIDSWEVFANGQPLTVRRSVAIRSYDRLIRYVNNGTSLWNEFCRSSEQARQLLESNPAPNLQDLFQPLTDLNSAGLMSFKERLKKSIGIKSNCPLPNCQKQKHRLLLEILESGIPIMFWARCGEPSLPDAITGIEQFLQVDLLRDRYSFLERVREARAVALDHRGQPERRWLRHLTLLWDDPKLMPPMDLLQVRGKASS